MIFLFAPALVSLVLILAMILREQFTIRRSVPMLDQIHAEVATRRLARERHRTSDVKRVLTIQASRVLVLPPEASDYIAPRDMRVTDGPLANGRIAQQWRAV